MSELDDIAARITEKVKDEDIGGVVRLDLEDAGVIRIANGAATPGDADDADCTIACTIEVFKDIAKGDLDPTAAFMQGKLKVDGDMGLAMQLAPLLG